MENSITNSPQDKRPRGKDLSNASPAWRGKSSNAAASAQSVPELFFQQVERCGNQLFCCFLETETETKRAITWHQAGADVIKVLEHLRKSGVKSGDRVGVFSATRYEWLIADMAILTLGAVSTPIYHTLTADEAGYVVWDADIKVVFAENQDQLGKLTHLEGQALSIPECEDHPAQSTIISFQQLITFDPVTRSDLSGRLTTFESILGATSVSNPTQVAAQYIKALKRDDLASIVYTSGTTGVPKGVVQTHANHLAMLSMVYESGLVQTGKDVFLFLPFAHSFARVIGYAIFTAGGSLQFPTVVNRKKSVFDAKQLFDDVAAHEPLILPSVPRLFEKVMSTLTDPNPKGAVPKFINGSIARGRKLKALQREGYPLAIHERAMLGFLKFLMTKVRGKLFGKRILYGISGGAPIAVPVLEFFQDLGLTILEGYGLTETTPAISANTREFCRFGTVGRIFPGIEVRIEENDGEILVRGPNIAQGYWKKAHATTEAWSTDGWFRTGDIGEVDHDGFLKITDRKKDLIVTASGKKIAPAYVEGRLKTSKYISQACLYGDRLAHAVALITLEEQNIRGWAQPNGVTGTIADLAKSPQVNALIEGEIKVINESLAPYERIKQFTILPEDFTIENGLLSPTLKLKRKLVYARFEPEIHELVRRLGS